MPTWHKTLAKKKSGWSGELTGGSVVGCSNPAQGANSNSDSNGTTTAVTFWQLFGLIRMKQWTSPIFSCHPSLRFLGSAIKALRPLHRREASTHKSQWGCLEWWRAHLEVRNFKPEPQNPLTLSRASFSAGLRQSSSFYGLRKCSWWFPQGQILNCPSRWSKSVTLLDWLVLARSLLSAPVWTEALCPGQRWQGLVLARTVGCVICWHLPCPSAYMVPFPLPPHTTV